MGDHTHIEAAARAIHDAAQSGVPWDSLGKASISFVRNMARAAAMEEWRKQNDGAWRLPSKLLAKEVEYWRESCRILAAELKDAKT